MPSSTGAAHLYKAPSRADVMKAYTVQACGGVGLKHAVDDREAAVTSTFVDDREAA